MELHREDAPEKVENEEKETQKGENTLSGERSTPVAEDDVSDIACRGGGSIMMTFPNIHIPLLN